MNQADPEMSLENDENLGHSMLLASTKIPEKTGEVGENSNPDFQICDFSLVDTFDSEIPGCSRSLSFTSEPPDIRNWFSSYIYESPDLDTEADFSNVVSGEFESEKAPVISEDIDRKNEKDLMALRTSADRDTSVYGEEISSEADNKLQKHSLIKDNSNLFVTNIGENKGLEHKPVENHEYVPINDDANSGSSDGDSLQKLEEKFSAKGDLILSKTSRSSSMNYVNSQEKDNLEGRHLTKEFDYNADSRESNGASLKKLLPCINSEKEKRKSTEMNGFVSTKKNYRRSENNRSFLNRTQENQIEHKRKTASVLPPVDEMHTKVVERRPLVERTNFQNEAAMPEVAGKWRCPQKSKPDLGPPMKQLRLERWINRV